MCSICSFLLDAMCSIDLVFCFAVISPVLIRRGMKREGRQRLGEIVRLLCALCLFLFILRCVQFV